MQDFLPADAFAVLMRDVGFVNVTVERMQVRRARELTELLQYASARHRASQFVAIADAAYEAGLERIRAAIVEAGSSPVTVDAGVSLVVIAGDRPADAGRP